MPRRERAKGVRTSRKPAAIDLFSGAGGLTLGLQQAGFRVLAGIELDDLAAETYRLNHPRVRLWESDIRSVDPQAVMAELKLSPGQLDLLAGCPPCQGFSSIRTRRRGTSEDARNSLLFEMLRFADALLPKAIMMENVPGLADDERLSSFVNRLRRRGYRVTWSVLDAADYGVAQRRRRLMLIAARELRVSPAPPDRRRISVADAIRPLPAPGQSNDPLHDIPEHRSDRVREIITAIPRDGGSRSALGSSLSLACHEKVRGFYDVYGRMAWATVAPTITGGCVNPSKGRFLHPEQDRAITLREAALLQSFPATYKFSLRRGKYAAAALIGNAFPPAFVRVHATSLRNALVRHTTQQT